MQLVSRLASRLTRLSGGRSDHSPLVLIAERFLPPAGELRHVNLPDDVLRVSDGRELDAVVVDAFGAVCRRARLLPPPPGMPGNRIDFAPIPILPGARMWLFVIDGEFDGGAITPRLVDDLLRHGRRLGGRPPIMLLFDSSNEAVLEIPDGAPRPNITFAMLSEDPDPALLPPLDQPDVDTARLTAEQRAWRQ